MAVYHIFKDKVLIGFPPARGLNFVDRMHLDSDMKYRERAKAL